MYIIDLLPKLGITEEMIELTIGDLNLSIDKGYEVRTQDIKTENAIQMIDIHPNVYWTDGTCRPKYTSGYACILLNKKIEISKKD